MAGSPYARLWPRLIKLGDGDGPPFRMTAYFDESQEGVQSQVFAPSKVLQNSAEERANGSLYGNCGFSVYRALNHLVRQSFEFTLRFD